MRSPRRGRQSRSEGDEGGSQRSISVLAGIVEMTCRICSSVGRLSRRGIALVWCCSCSAGNKQGTHRQSVCAELIGADGSAGPESWAALEGLTCRTRRRDKVDSSLRASFSVVRYTSRFETIYKDSC